MGATDEPREQRPSWAQQSEGTATEEPDFPVDPTLTQESSEQHPPQQKQEQQEQQEEKMEQQQEQQEHPEKQKQPQRPEQDEEWYDFSKKEKHDPWKSYKDNNSKGWTGASDRKSNTWQQP